MRIGLLNGDSGPEVETGLADVMLDCVAGGASVGFLQGLSHDEARTWWRAMLWESDARTWVGWDVTGRVVGTVSLILVTKPNAPHRAEVVKLLVHRDVRGRGYASALLDAVEDGARRLGRTTLILDTETGSPAESLYERRGCKRVGTVEDYAARPDGVLTPTTFMCKHL